MATHAKELTAAETGFRITRTFDVPRELVFKAWTDPVRLIHWWGPKGFSLQVVKFDLRPGGMMLSRMSGPNGMEMWGKFVFREIEPPGRMVFVNSFSDPDGGNTRHPMAPDWPLEMLNVLALEERDGKTALTLSGGPINATPEEEAVYKAGYAPMQDGFKGTFDQLEAYLAEADREIVITRLVDAPRERVFAAFTTPGEVEKWWGPKGFTTTTAEMNVTPGGVWRFTMHGPDGVDYPNFVRFAEVRYPDKLVHLHGTAEDEPMMFESTISFFDVGGKTQVTMRLLLNTAEERNAAATYAIDGGNSTMDCLEEYLAAN